MRMLRCPKCHEEIAEISRRCQYCEVEVTLTEDQNRFLFANVTCPRCQRFNPVCHRYCGQCALPLTKHCLECGVETLFDARVCGRCRNFFGHPPGRRRDPDADVPAPDLPTGAPHEAVPATATASSQMPLPFEPALGAPDVLLGDGSRKEEAGEGQRRILVVDDEPFIGKLVKMVLELEGFSVDVASSVEEARRIVAECPPVLVITDIMMPGEDGYALLRDLKARSETRPVHVLVLSVMTDFEELRRSVVSGAVDHLSKPFDPAELVWVVKRALGEYASWERREELVFA